MLPIIVFVLFDDFFWSGQSLHSWGSSYKKWVLSAEGQQISGCAQTHLCSTQKLRALQEMCTEGAVGQAGFTTPR